MSGYDINPVEPENFTMVNTLEEAVIGQDIVFVAVQTPHDPNMMERHPPAIYPIRTLTTR